MTLKDLLDITEIHTEITLAISNSEVWSVESEKIVSEKSRTLLNMQQYYDYEVIGLQSIGTDELLVVIWKE